MCCNGLRLLKIASWLIKRKMSQPRLYCLNAVNLHYTFDFAQALAISHHARQEVPLYFLTPRKVQLFGVAIEGQYRQLNDFLDEDQVKELGKTDRAGIKGTNDSSLPHMACEAE